MPTTDTTNVIHENSERSQTPFLCAADSSNPNDSDVAPAVLFENETSDLDCFLEIFFIDKSSMNVTSSEAFMVN